MRIAVLGSGGVGGYCGALLAKGGHNVVFIARGAHLESLQQRVLTVRTPEGESTIPVNAVADTRSLAPVDLVLFCVKSYDTAPAAQALPSLMARDTAMVTAGAVANGAWFGPIVWPRPRVLACAGGQCK